MSYDGFMDLGAIKGVITLDVEDWDHANFEQLQIKRERISTSVRGLKYAMDSNIDLWIRILGEFGVKSTCFVLGEFVKRFPDAVQRLDRAGHEIASHGPSHDLVYQMKQKQFREFLKRGLGALGDLLGKTPRGFRAPSWSVDERTPWFCEELAEQKIIYDSSLYPVKTPLFGQEDGPTAPFWDGQIFRIPPTVWRIGPFRIPVASGASFRILPLSFTRSGLKQAAQEKNSVMLVLHPRELDPIHPRLPLNGWEGKVHYAGLSSTLPKLKTLLSEMSWTTIESFYAEELEKRPNDRS
jgi:polysaccharide deacetylase family protein (PEP-CTERM system associated)